MSEVIEEVSHTFHDSVYRLLKRCESAPFQRELDAAPADSWFQPQTPHDDHPSHPFDGFFNPPSMVGNRQTAPPRPPPQDVNPLAEMMRLMSGALVAPATPSHGGGGGPRVRTFTFGNPAGGGIMGGATISIGGGPVLGTDEHGFVRDPWGGDAFGRGARGPTAEQGAQDRFGGDGGGGGGQAPWGAYRPAPGDYVTIEDLLAHFLGGMSVVGGAGTGSGNLGDYVMSDGEPSFYNPCARFDPESLILASCRGPRSGVGAADACRRRA